MSRRTDRVTLLLEKGMDRRSLLRLGALAGLTAVLPQGLSTEPPRAPSASAVVRFAVIADPHVDVHGENAMKMSAESLGCLEATVKALNLEPDLAFVLLAGDLLLDGEVENAAAVKRILKRLQVPSYMVAGNHDYAPAPDKQRPGYRYLSLEDFVHFFEGHGYDRSGRRYYSLEPVPGVRLIALDACLPGTGRWGGCLPVEQLEFLEQELRTHPVGQPLILIHHNLIRWTHDEERGGPKDQFAIDNDLEVRNLLRRFGSRSPIVLSGHRHIGLRTFEEEGVNYFVCPSLNSYPLRYTVLELSPGAICWKTPMVPVSAGVHLSSRRNLLADEWWRPEGTLPASLETDQRVLSVYDHPEEVVGEVSLN